MHTFGALVFVARHNLKFILRADSFSNHCSIPYFRMIRRIATIFCKIALNSRLTTSNKLLKIFKADLCVGNIFCLIKAQVKENKGIIS